MGKVNRGGRKGVWRKTGREKSEGKKECGQGERGTGRKE